MANRAFTKKQTIIFLLALLLGASLVAFLYFKLLYPVQNSVDIKRSELESEKKMAEVLMSKGNSAQETTFESTMELQKHLPVKPLVEQIVLELEKAEITSNSFIVSMNVHEDEEAAPGEEQEAAEAEEDLNHQDTGGEQDENSSEVLPKGLKKVDIEMTVQSLTYQDLENFIAALENSVRIMKVTDLKFNGGVEIMTIEQNPERLSYSVTVSAFYHPGLTDLIKELPPMDSPAPAKKTNPFNNDSELPEPGNSTSETSSIEP
ncbi:pilus assembly protein PilO [Peribacillus deserti]|uniref:Pilus assembly protein PilO n=1 Tax=Peribacillus deserti TaxID=673318 RepID=A0A2N5M6Z9_9BACI|nr:pilus assembly protein PilO [Peribacillus deserti]PLT30148.1 pilus assembly protein PilO [Peribacillus deserti]